MIASLDGVVSAVFADSLILEVGGVGYRVFAAPAVLSAATTGERLKVFTHHVIREDFQALYGFRNPQELGFFGLLLTVTGVGPKVALGIVGSRPVGDLQLAILSDDLALLTAVPGVGKKLAARVVLELKEKVAAAGVSVGGMAGMGPAAGESEVVAALLALGYSAGEARQASRDALADPAVGAGLEDRVKAALRTLLRG
ncbi:MAG TPA: Holliday junction branch migration protein RuvA [Candidatus Limnocylindrales bacterium]